ARRGVKVNVYVDGAEDPVTRTLADVRQGELTLVSKAPASIVGVHSAVVYVADVGTSGQRWAGKSRGSLRVTGFRLSPGAATFPLAEAAPASRPAGPAVPEAVAAAHRTAGQTQALSGGGLDGGGRGGVTALFFGSSSVDGHGLALPEMAFPGVLSRSLGWEYGQIGWPGQGWGLPASAVPAFYGDGRSNDSTWREYWDGKPRLGAGGFKGGAPDVIVVYEGHNDAVHGSAAMLTGMRLRVAAWLAEVRALAPRATVYLIAPFRSGAPKAAQHFLAAVEYLKDGAEDYLAAHPGAAPVHVIELGEAGYRYSSGDYSHLGDNTHPTAAGHRGIATLLAQRITGLSPELAPGESEDQVRPVVRCAALTRAKATARLTVKAPDAAKGSWVSAVAPRAGCDYVAAGGAEPRARLGAGRKATLRLVPGEEYWIWFEGDSVHHPQRIVVTAPAAHQTSTQPFALREGAVISGRVTAPGGGAVEGWVAAVGPGPPGSGSDSAVDAATGSALDAGGAAAGGADAWGAPPRVAKIGAGGRYRLTGLTPADAIPCPGARPRAFPVCPTAPTARTASDAAASDSGYRVSAVVPGYKQAWLGTSRTEWGMWDATAAGKASKITLGRAGKAKAGADIVLKERAGAVRGTVRRVADGGAGLSVRLGDAGQMEAGGPRPGWDQALVVGVEGATATFAAVGVRSGVWWVDARGGGKHATGAVEVAAGGTARVGLAAKQSRREPERFIEAEIKGAAVAGRTVTMGAKAADYRGERASKTGLGIAYRWMAGAKVVGTGRAFTIPASLAGLKLTGFVIAHESGAPPVVATAAGTGVTVARG
ncbi:MAG: SGNH/GDSL hydrolase family protein, partial [Bifidobacteriaceae bacterium]|nr:SGNH/GDSL hydrolase family protein [Bifidobacteriaceae bacterium]